MITLKYNNLEITEGYTNLTSETMLSSPSVSQTKDDNMNNYLNKSLEIWNNGFVSKSSKKKALDYLRSAYYQCTKMIRDDLLSVPMESRQSKEWREKYWSIPDFHYWREKHSLLFSSYSEIVKEIENLVELRKAMKETEVTPSQKIVSKEQIKRYEIEQSIHDLMIKRKTKYLEGVKLADQFGLDVSVTSHLVTNQYGTQFVRCFYYLFGKMTALNTIIAVAQKHKENQGGK